MTNYQWRRNAEARRTDGKGVALNTFGQTRSFLVLLNMTCEGRTRYCRHEQDYSDKRNQQRASEGVSHSTWAPPIFEEPRGSVDGLYAAGLSGRGADRCAAGNAGTVLSH